MTSGPLNHQKGKVILETQKITQQFDNQKGPQEYLQIGTRLEGRYLIEDIVGRGGMGAVYAARDMRFSVKKIVAVKEMINQATDAQTSETIIQNFEREANILATLSHPSIPTIYDFFTLGERSYLVMEFILGDNLETLLKEHPGFISEEQALSWAMELCDVLHYLHTHDPEPIIFRDIKPANILVKNNTQISLVDFGIAKTFQSGKKGTMIGTEGYSPPEQYRGVATPQVDIYALGATLHHILTKTDPRTEPPFTFHERPIQRINPTVSDELVEIINRSLEYEASSRFSTAFEMKKALIACARQTGKLSGETLEAVTRVYDEKRHEPLWTFKCEDEIRGTPTYQAGNIYIGAYDNNIYTLDASSGELIWKYAAEGGIVSKPALYEGYIFFGSVDKKVHAVTIRSGKSVWSYPTGGAIYSSPQVAEKHVFIGSDDEHLYVLNTLSGREAWKTNVGSRVRSSPLVLADRVIFGTDDGDIYCYDFGGETIWHTAAKRSVMATPHYDDGVIYITSMDSHLYAIDAKTGWVIWRYRLGSGSISSPATKGDYVYVGDSDGELSCINIHTSKKSWAFSTDNQINGSPAVYKNAVYFGSIDGNIYSLTADKGEIRWQYKTKGPITGSPVAANDVIYIGSTDQTLYALPA